MALTIKTDFSGFDQEAVKRAAEEALYEHLKSIVPEIENEKGQLKYIHEGAKVYLDPATEVSDELLKKLKDNIHLLPTQKKK